MSTLPRSARVVLMVVVTLGAVCLFGMARLPHPDESTAWIFVSLTLGAVVLSAVKMHLPTTKSRATMSASFVIDFSALLLLGTEQALLVAFAGALSQSLLGSRRNPLHRTAYNAATFVLTVAATGAVYHALGGTTGRFHWPDDITAVAGAATTFYLVNSGLIGLIVALATEKRVLAVWRHNFLGSWSNYVLGSGLAITFVEALVHELWGLLPVVAVPVFLTYRAYRAYATRVEEEQRHREIIESLNEGMLVVDREGIVRLWNDALERIIAIGRERAEGRRLLDVVPTLAGTDLPPAIARALDTREPVVLDEFEFKGGQRRHVLQVRLLPFAGGVTVFWQDVSDRAEAQRALRESEERYALAAAGANDGLWDWDLLAETIHFSARWRDMLGLPNESGTGTLDDWMERVHPDDRPGLRNALHAHIKGATVHFQHEHRMRHVDGGFRWMLCKGAAVRLPDGTATRLAGSLTDVTERVQTQEQLRHAAHHDALTGLPNRPYLVEALRATLARAQRPLSPPCAVIFLDLDRFKIINDSLGHHVGDELLVAVARRLQRCVRDGDLVARLGGDEFVVLLDALHQQDRARVVAERILEAIEAPFSIAGREVYTSTSLGIAISRPDSTDPDGLMRDADSAMYRAKLRGKARFEFFDADLHAQVLDRLGLENDLRRAVERQELSLEYQPIVSLASGQPVGVEALVRWTRAGVAVSPATFIPVAEEIGLIEPLGAWVLREACLQFARWQQSMGPHAVDGIAVNVSTRQLVQPSFVSIVQAAVRDAGMRPSALHLEITETALMRNPDVVEDVLRQLRAFGVKIYLDDFGTGYSSLSHLHRLPVDALKIDRSFVASLVDRDRPAIVESILALARTLGTPVIAEGIETEEQLRELTRLGCEHGQGYYFSKSLPPDEAELYMASALGASDVIATAPALSLVRVTGPVASTAIH